MRCIRGSMDSLCPSCLPIIPGVVRIIGLVQRSMTSTKACRDTSSATLLLATRKRSGAGSPNESRMVERNRRDHQPRWPDSTAARDANVTANPAPDCEHTRPARAAGGVRSMACATAAMRSATVTPATLVSAVSRSPA